MDELFGICVGQHDEGMREEGVMKAESDPVTATDLVGSLEYPFSCDGALQEVLIYILGAVQGCTDDDFDCEAAG
jgi:hypothetical protein